MMNVGARRSHAVRDSTRASWEIGFLRGARVLTFALATPSSVAAGRLPSTRSPFHGDRPVTAAPLYRPIAAEGRTASARPALRQLGQFLTGELRAGLPRAR